MSCPAPLVDVEVFQTLHSALYPGENKKKWIMVLHCIAIKHVKKYLMMHDFGIPRHPQSIKACKVLTEYKRQSLSKIALWECCGHALFRRQLSISIFSVFVTLKSKLNRNIDNIIMMINGHGARMVTN